jgi:FkbM family methyltransferase
VVVDIGAHIGSFSLLAQLKGAAMVLAYEAERSNFEMLLINLEGSNVVKASNAAVWRSGAGPLQLRYQHSLDPLNTGGGTVFSAEGQLVNAVAFDDVLSTVPAVDLLKIDCEGSEYAILGTSTELCRVREIVGEYHNLTFHIPDFARIPGFSTYTGSALALHLESEGFTVRTASVTRDLGKFHAWRAGHSRCSDLLPRRIACTGNCVSHPQKR